MTTENSIELLAPAGSVTALKAVIEAGAERLGTSAGVELMEHFA